MYIYIYIYIYIYTHIHKDNILSFPWLLNSRSALREVLAHGDNLPFPRDRLVPSTKRRFFPLHLSAEVRLTFVFQWCTESNTGSNVSRHFSDESRSVIKLDEQSSRLPVRRLQFLFFLFRESCRTSRVFTALGGLSNVMNCHW